jgi:hypothetical protein
LNRSAAGGGAHAEALHPGAKPNRRAPQRRAGPRTNSEAKEVVTARAASRRAPPHAAAGFRHFARAALARNATPKSPRAHACYVTQLLRHLRASAASDEMRTP